MGELSVHEAYRRMAFIRQFEQKCLELSNEGEIAGSIHLCLGQEAIPVGALSALRPGDRVLSTYRGHGWALACGSDPLALLAEIAQRADGLNGGRAGSPLLSDPDNGFLGENSIVGGGVPIAAGVALALSSRAEDGVVVCSIGDGAMNQGATTEGMVFAAARNLPVIFICENNGWSEMTPISATTRGPDLVVRGEALGIESHVVDGGDPFAVARAVAAAAQACRNGEGPVYLECKTVRLSGHYNRDIQHYRPKEDVEAAERGDPITRLVASAAGDLSDDAVDAIDGQVAAEVEALGRQVRAMPAPDPASVLDHVYAAQPQSRPVPAAGPPEETRELTYQRAVNLALRTELRERPEVVVYGEDVGKSGGIFGVSRGLWKEFGDARVFDTPIAEAAILGSAVGAAIAGLRPVVEIMWADFTLVALDQIVNQAANVRYINRSRLSAPLTIRMQQGVTPGSCAQHSQSIESILAHVPGIKVGLPATAQDAYAMTRAAVADPDPVVLIEGRRFYQDVGTVHPNSPIEPTAGARRRRDGADLAIVCWGAVVSDVMTAADRLAADGISATVLDLRWLRPIDDDAIAAAVRDGSGRVLVVHEDTVTGGFGAEIAARISEAHFPELRSAVRRLGCPDIRMPSAPSLQAAVLPAVSRIVDTARELLKAPTSSLPSPLTAAHEEV
ncbi:thiamine pyrophosphate-dependent enzyme [Streptosporangium sp. NBC_01639]|uniref:alpha-ketoacid dehydrogenase subunit alpha/beta n=1 Tax=Streptosporangium sp. NBC_01639 TaxID=2975948 RepID=UPI0038701974|nr:thiamine pyrophosphate-dependent enzyme [Streptosporangium sp. NBC_01639]